jgi:hypothetical protein
MTLHMRLRPHRRVGSAASVHDLPVQALSTNIGGTLVPVMGIHKTSLEPDIAVLGKHFLRIWKGALTGECVLLLPGFVTQAAPTSSDKTDGFDAILRVQPRKRRLHVRISETQN